MALFLCLLLTFFLRFLPNRCSHARPLLIFFSSSLLFHSLFLFNKNQTIFFSTHQYKLDSPVWTIMTSSEKFFLHSFFVYRHMEEAKKEHSLRINMFIIFYSCLFLHYIVTLECSAYIVTYTITNIFVGLKNFFF